MVKLGLSTSWSPSAPGAPSGHSKTVCGFCGWAAKKRGSKPTARRRIRSDINAYYNPIKPVRKEKPGAYEFPANERQLASVYPRDRPPGNVDNEGRRRSIEISRIPRANT